MHRGVIGLIFGLTLILGIGYLIYYFDITDQFRWEVIGPYTIIYTISYFSQNKTSLLRRKPEYLALILLAAFLVFASLFFRN